MAQLSDDRAAFGGRLLPLDDALAEIGRRTGCVAAPREIGIREALGAVLAEDVESAHDVPPHPNSAVDGYAFRFADLAGAGPHLLALAGRADAGHPMRTSLRTGAAARVLTGAPLPRGADTVLMDEDAELRDGSVLVPDGLRRGANARPAGEDVAHGTTAVAAGRRLGAADLGLLAALGRTRVRVRAPLRVGVLSSGDELVDPGTALGPGQVHDSNRAMLLGLAAAAGARAEDLGILPDDAAKVRARIPEAAAGRDLLLASGGMSASEEDHLRRALGELGTLHFWRLAVKPGRPVGFGEVGGTPVVGLPGNPVAAFVTFALLARPLIAALRGESWRPPAALAATSGFAYRKKAGRREFVRVRLGPGPNGPVAERFPRDGAGILSSVSWADGLAVLGEEATEVRPGDRVGYLPFAGLVA